MNTNWAKILLFTLIGFGLGFLVSRSYGDRGCHRGGCERMMSCHASGGHGCGHHGGKSGCCSQGNGKAEADGAVRNIVKELEARDFQGDTTVMIDGGSVQVTREGEKLEVKVEMDNMFVEEEKEIRQ